MKWIVAYLCAAIVFGVLDAMWLQWAGPNLYRPMIGEIMADNFNITAAGFFYLIYIAGIVWFAIRPGLENGQVTTTLLNGVLLGGLCYATFDLTGQAVFKVWETKMTIIDITWGMFATGTAAATATLATRRLSN